MSVNIHLKWATQAPYGEFSGNSISYVPHVATPLTTDGIDIHQKAICSTVPRVDSDTGSAKSSKPTHAADSGPSSLSSTDTAPMQVASKGPSTIPPRQAVPQPPAAPSTAREDGSVGLGKIVVGALAVGVAAVVLMRLR